MERHARTKIEMASAKRGFQTREAQEIDISPTLAARLL